MELNKYFYNLGFAMKEFMYIYPTPTNLTYYWNFGVYLLYCLAIQIISGILLLSYYTNSTDLAFQNLEIYMREVPHAELTRYAHANGASLFFFAIFIHLVRGVKYGSSTLPLVEVWLIGIILFILLIAIAFAGYVLPWGQMSYWAATVIIQLFSAIPQIGVSIVFWIWGGFTLGDTSLRRIFSLHMVTPFILAFFVLIHIFYLHLFGSGQPEAIHALSVEHTSMNPYYIWKDLNGLCLFNAFYSILVFLQPNILGHWDNYEFAKPTVTPTHIMPEWYYLWIYAILRSVPHKLLGVVAVILALLLLVFLPWMINPGLKQFISIFDSNIVTIWSYTAFIGFLILGGLTPISQVLISGRFCLIIYLFSLNLLNISFLQILNYKPVTFNKTILKIYRYYKRFKLKLRKRFK